MKVYPDKLERELKRGAAPVYIVSGDEPLLVQESCDVIRRSLKAAGYTERQVFHVEANFDWEQVLFSANSLSLFADQKLLEIRMPGGKPGDKGAVALKTYMENPPEGTVMLMVTPRLDAPTQRTKWFQALEGAGAFVQVWPVDVKQMPRWIKERFNRAGLEVTHEAVEMVVSRVEGNLLAAVQEIERLSLTADGRRIDADDVMESVADNARYSIYSLIDTAVGGDPARTLKILQGLRAEGTDVLHIVALLASETRTLARMADGVSKGQSLDAVTKNARIWPKRKDLVSRALKRHNRHAIDRIQQKLTRVDQSVKGILPGDAWTELTDVLLNLAGKRVVPEPTRIRSV